LFDVEITYKPTSRYFSLKDYTTNDNVFVNKEPVIMIAHADLTRSMVIAQIFEVLEEKEIEII